MIFEVGKFYKHNAGHKLHIICEADTLTFGHALIAEDQDGELIPVATKEWASINFCEITKEEWLSE